MKSLCPFSIISLILLLGLISCDQNINSKLEANKDIVRQFAELVNNNNYNALDDIVADNFVRNSQATPEVKISSLDEFKQFGKMNSESFPDMKGVIELMVAEGGYVAAYVTFTGTQEGPMGSFPATGKKMESKTMAIFRLENNKIAELWIEWDNLAILSQLGHLPPPGMIKK